jgi:hypothetical protein
MVCACMPGMWQHDVHVHRWHLANRDSLLSRGQRHHDFMRASRTSSIAQIYNGYLAGLSLDARQRTPPGGVGLTMISLPPGSAVWLLHSSG